MWSVLVPFVLWNTLTVAQADVQAWQEFERDCKRGVHIQCLRQGIRLVRSKKLSRVQTIQVYQRLAMAYDSIGRGKQAMVALQRLLKVAPCQRKFPLLDDEIAGKLKKARSLMYEQDTAPPLLTHIPPARSSFLKSPSLSAQANDDLGVLDVVVFYRFQNKGSFSSQPLKQGKGNRYSVAFPVSMLKDKKRFEYYIQARDCSGRTTLSVSQPSKPQVVFLEIPVEIEPMRVMGNVMLGVGIISLLGGALSFYAAFTALQRWYDIKDITASEVVRDEIVLYHVIGWIGVGVGALTLGLGGVFSFRPKQKPRKTPGVASTHSNSTHSTLRLLKMQSW